MSEGANKVALAVMTEMKDGGGDVESVSMTREGTTKCELSNSDLADYYEENSGSLVVDPA